MLLSVPLRLWVSVLKTLCFCLFSLGSSIVVLRSVVPCGLFAVAISFENPNHKPHFHPKSLSYLAFSNALPLLLRARGFSVSPCTLCFS